MDHIHQIFIGHLPRIHIRCKLNFGTQYFLPRRVLCACDLFSPVHAALGSPCLQRSWFPPSWR